MVSITCRRTNEGCHDAHRTLALQIPLITQEFPEISDCYHGTVNVRLDVGLQIKNYDYQTNPIIWEPQGSPEVFGFLRICFEAPINTPAFKAWLYIAHNSPHYDDPTFHEVIAKKLDLQGVLACRINFDRQIEQTIFNGSQIISVV